MFGKNYDTKNSKIGFLLLKYRLSADFKNSLLRKMFLNGEPMRKGDLVEYKDPLPDEEGLKFILLEDPDGERVLAEAVVDLVIRPSYILQVSDIKMSDQNLDQQSM